MTPKVLIVEDEPRMREMLERAVVEAGFEAATARSAELAQKTMETPAPPQIVLLDLNLPGADGMEFLQQLRTGNGGANVQVIILTGFGSLDAAKLAIRHDVVDFLTKPCKLEDLDVALARARQRLTEKCSPLPMIPPADSEPASTSGESTLEHVERQHILAVLARHHGNRAGTAAELGISERTLYYRLARYQQQGISVE
jgi:DNA-binding NtrC family response regulator